MKQKINIKMIIFVIILFGIMILPNKANAYKLLTDETGSRSFSSASGNGVYLNLWNLQGSIDSYNGLMDDEGKSIAEGFFYGDNYMNIYDNNRRYNFGDSEYYHGATTTYTNNAIAYAIALGKENTNVENDVSQNVYWYASGQGYSYSNSRVYKNIQLADGVSRYCANRINPYISRGSGFSKRISGDNVVVGPFYASYPKGFITSSQNGAEYCYGAVTDFNLYGTYTNSNSTTEIAYGNWYFSDYNGNKLDDDIYYLNYMSGSSFYLTFGKAVAGLSYIQMSTMQYYVDATLYKVYSSNSKDILIVGDYDSGYDYRSNTSYFNYPIRGTMTVRKVDYSTSAGLSGAQFKIYNSDIGKYVYQRSDSLGRPMVYFVSESEASVFTTNSSGTFSVYGLPQGQAGNYQIIETKPPDPYNTFVYIEKAAPYTQRTIDGSTVTAIIRNQVKTGHLVLRKVDYDNTSRVLSSAQLKVYTISGGQKKYVTSTSTTSSATTTTSSSSAKIYYSGDTLYNLVAGTWYIEEVKSENEQYSVLALQTVTVYAQQTVTSTVKNKRMVANIQILKKDYDTRSELSGAQFVVYRMVGGTKEYVLNCYNSTTTLTTYTTSISSARKFATNEIAYNLVFQKNGTTYYVEEIKTPSEYYPIFPSPNVQTFNLTESYRLRTQTATFLNIKYVSNLTITKIDQDTKKPLQGVEFEITRLNTKTNRTEYIYVSGTTAQVSSSNRTLYTNSSGQIVLNDLIIKVPQTYAGETIYDYRYRIKEVSNNVKDYDGDYIYHGYRGYPDDEYYDSGWFTFSRLENKKTTITNERQIIDFKGYAWEERQTNNLYGSGDKLLPGITAKLINTKTNEIIETQTTGSDGSYKFNNINLPSIRQYGTSSPSKLNVKIVFEYDGFEYEAVDYSTASNGSKAIEDAEDRMALNQGFAQLTGTGTTDRTYSFFRDPLGNKTYRVNYYRGQVPSARITPLK